MALPLGILQKLNVFEFVLCGQYNTSFQGILSVF
jgi:hypothetical protein